MRTTGSTASSNEVTPAPRLTARLRRNVFLVGVFLSVGTLMYLSWTRALWSWAALGFALSLFAALGAAGSAFLMFWIALSDDDESPQSVAAVDPVGELAKRDLSTRDKSSS